MLLCEVKQQPKRPLLNNATAAWLMRCIEHSGADCSLCCCYANSDLPCRFIRQHHMVACPASCWQWLPFWTWASIELHTLCVGCGAAWTISFFKLHSNSWIEWQHLVGDEQCQQRDAEGNTRIPCLSSAFASCAQQEAISHLHTKGQLMEDSRKQVAGYPTTCIFGLQSNENVVHKYQSTPSFSVSF